MSSDAAAAPNDHDEPGIWILAPLGVEYVCLASLRGNTAPARSLMAVQCGPGAANAQRAVADAVNRGARACISFGVAGALENGIAPGTVMLPSRVFDSSRAGYAVDAIWRRSVLEAVRGRFPVHEGDLVSVDSVLTTPRSKARAALEFSAAACDLESAAMAEAAQRAGLDFLALRVISDGLTDELPRDVEHWVDARGNRRLSAVAAVVFAPGQWPHLVTAARCFAAARRTMVGLASELGPAAFAHPGAESR